MTVDTKKYLEFVYTVTSAPSTDPKILEARLRELDANGADVSKLIDLDCHLQVLNQSYRIPKTIFAKSNNLVSRIKKRINKEWQPRKEEGKVEE